MTYFLIQSALLWFNLTIKSGQTRRIDVAKTHGCGEKQPAVVQREHFANLQAGRASDPHHGKLTVRGGGGDFERWNWRAAGETFIYSKEIGVGRGLVMQEPTYEVKKCT